MMLQTNLQTRRFKDPMRLFAAIRRFEHWKKSGSVRLVDFGGRQNVVCLQNKKRIATIRISPQLTVKRPYKVTVDIFSPIGNKAWGVGTLIGDEPIWHPSNGMWKKIEGVLSPGTELVIEATGKDRLKVTGDKCYVDLMSLLML